MAYETPYRATHPIRGSGHYNPISIGQAATCPEWSLWWLLAAAAAGGWAGWQYSKSQKKDRRR